LELITQIIETYASRPAPEVNYLWDTLTTAYLLSSGVLNATTGYIKVILDGNEEGNVVKADEGVCM
jgi:inosine-uridine nucleoside N-ribohydrolase